MKKLLTGTAFKLQHPAREIQGNGLGDLHVVRTSPLPSVSASSQPFPAATGTGSLDASRGSERLEDNGKVLSGEEDIFGRAFNSHAWAGASGARTSWTGGRWTGSGWTGSRWTGTRWRGSLWASAGWN